NQPEEILRAATESVLRELVGSRSFADLLTANRQRLQEQVLQEVDRRCQRYGNHGLGIALDGLSLHDLHPPQEVVGAYHEVTQAMQGRDKDINQARAAAIEMEGDAQESKLNMVAKATAEKHEIIKQHRSEQATLQARYRARTELDWFDEARVFLTA